MYKTTRNSVTGYVLIEALVAVLIVALGVLALTKLEAMVISSAGESRSRSEAMAISQAQMEVLRNSVLLSQFPANATGTAQTSGQNATYNLAWSITTPDASLAQRLVALTTTWTDRFGNTQTLTLNSQVAWNDPLGQGALTKNTSGNLISPTGSAKRGVGSYTGQGVSTQTGSDNVTKLIDTGTGKTILYLDPDSSNQAQQFTTISGRIYFDQSVNGNAIPGSADVRVRLSSEGECIYNSADANLITVPTGATGNNIKYKYFAYTCYVGPGWYGNVGLMIDSDVNGSAASPTICLGDPTFNSGVSNSTSTSAHPIESTTRTYRGFKVSGNSYLSTGVAGARTYPSDGYPVPSTYPAYYSTITAGSASDYFDQNFLITHISGNGSCKAQLLLVAGEFTRNAGKYYCITPDDQTSDNDTCPSVWPGYESEVGSGGSINYSLTVTNNDTTRGTVTSSPSGINCGTTCSGSFASGSTVTLTATPVSGSTFTGWGGACSGTGTCSVTMSSNQAVTATFAAGTTSYTLSVTKSGTGTGTVSSSPSGISCGSTCSASYTSGTSVTLSAAADTGSTFTGWSGGGCSGTGSCTVTMSSAQAVTATFATSTPSTYTLAVTKSGSGSGTVTSSPSGISCGSTCSASFTTGTAVTLTATASSGSTFSSWGGACSGSSSTCTVTMSAAQAVTASFSPSSCSTPISGTAHDKFGSVSVSPSSAGSCSMNGGNSAGYSCTLTTASGTAVTLTNSKTTGNVSTQYSYSLGVTANCVAQTNVNFP